MTVAAHSPKVTIPAVLDSHTSQSPNKTSADAIQRLVRWGFRVSALLVFGVGGWAFATEISGAVVSVGTLVVDSNVKKVQHPYGGVIGEIRVRDGLRVKKDDIVLRLDETITRANYDIVRKGVNELMARKARLEAERDQKTTISFPNELMALLGEPEIATLVANEKRLFEFRAGARAGQKALIQERIEQAHNEIKGLTAQAKAKSEEIALIQRELTGIRALFAKNLIPISKLTALEREAVRLTGERGQFISAIAQANGRIAELNLSILQIDRETISEAGKELREIEIRLGETIEKKIAAEDQLKRIDIRAPQSGVVHQMNVHTVGGVIGAGEQLMLVVPDTDELTAEVKIAPQDIDQLYIGQTASIRFSAFNRRTTPEINGKVAQISADVTADLKTGANYYTVRISITSSEVARLGDAKLVPGMPVETMIKTGDRRVISYLIKPFQDQLQRTFRER